MAKPFNSKFPKKPGSGSFADSDDPAIAQLRVQGETVVCVMPGHEHAVDEFQCDRELVEVSGEWLVRAV